MVATLQADLSTPLLVTAVVSGVLPLIYAALRMSRFLTRNVKIHPEKGLKALSREFAKWESLGLIPFLLFAAAATIGFTEAFNQWFSVPSQTDSILLRGEGFLWGIPGLLLGMVLAMAPTQFLISVCLGRRYSDFECYLDMRTGVNNRRLFLVLVVFVGFLAAISIVFLQQFYWRFDTDRFAINPFLSVTERIYEYSEIQELRYVQSFRAPNGNVKKRPSYEIEISDGTVWNSRQGPAQDHQTLRDLFITLERKTGLKTEIHDVSPSKP